MRMASKIKRRYIFTCIQKENDLDESPALLTHISTLDSSSPFNMQGWTMYLWHHHSFFHIFQQILPLSVSQPDETVDGPLIRHWWLRWMTSGCCRLLSKTPTVTLYLASLRKIQVHHDKLKERNTIWNCKKQDNPFYPPNHEQKG